MNALIRIPLLLAVGVVVSSATSFSNLVHVQSSSNTHPDCIDTSPFQDTMLSLSSCLSGCVELHSAFVNVVDNDGVHTNTKAYNTTTISTTKNKPKTSYSRMKVAALLLLFILAFATMKVHQLLLLMTMLLVSGPGLSTDVFVSFFGAWIVNYYLGVTNQTEQEEGYDIEEDMYYDCEEKKESFGLTWKEGKLRWIEI